MDQVEEPMDLDVDVTFMEVKLEDSAELNIKSSDQNDSSVPAQIPEARYENRAGTFTTGIDIFSEKEKLKMEERAKRFGLGDKIKGLNYCRDDDLYSSMGIVEESENQKNFRLNVIHVRGTEKMSTKDIFKYFEDYAPASIEWINDISCNVVWLDNVSAARALLGLSKKINGLDEKLKEDEHRAFEAESNLNVKNDVVNDSIVEVESYELIGESENNKNENVINVKDINCPLPPGLWRKGIDYHTSKDILLRFATRADKKQPNAEKMSEYYKKYGNPNFGGVKGILTESRKRMYKETKQSKRRTKQNVLDDDINRKEIDVDNESTKNPWGALSQSWGVNDSTEYDFIQKNSSKDQGSNVKERLGLKCRSKDVPLVSEESESNSESDSEEEWCKRSKVLRMRMHADDEEEKVRKRRSKYQHQVISINRLNNSDLRSRLGRSRNVPLFPDAIQVVVTNTQINNSCSPNPDKSEQEEGEIVEETGSEEKEEEEEEEEREEVAAAAAAAEAATEEWEEEKNEDDEESELSEKEVQGPKGSVIKVVQHKPRVASTVWARLNHVKTEANDIPSNERRLTRGDLRDTLKGGDLRSRLGKNNRGRSPLRIEVKNDKYTKENNSDTE